MNCFPLINILSDGMLSSLLRIHLGVPQGSAKRFLIALYSIESSLSISLFLRTNASACIGGLS